MVELRVSVASEYISISTPYAGILIGKPSYPRNLCNLRNPWF